MKYLFAAVIVLLLSAAVSCDLPDGVVDLIETTTTIPAGGTWWRGYGLDAGTRVSGDFTTDGPDITFYVLDQVNHLRWDKEEQFDYRVEVVGSSGGFSFTYPGQNETYFFCLDNRAGTGPVEVTIDINTEE